MPVREEGIHYWMGVKGLKEFRAYRDSVAGSAVVDMEFKDFSSWGKAMDSEECKSVMAKFASYTSNCKWALYDASPVIPEPLKPKQPYYPSFFLNPLRGIF